MNQKIIEIVNATLIEMSQELGKPQLANPTPETRIFGGEGALDSIALVSFIADLEGRISSELETDIILADELAMSQKTSPFRSVSTLTAYIVELMKNPQ
jgi:acyl carrier protein